MITNELLTRYGWKEHPTSSTYSHRLYSHTGILNAENESFLVSLMDTEIITDADIAFISHLIHIAEGKEKEWSTTPGE